MKKGHQSRAHAPFAPSGAERWLNCPAAVRYEALLPDQEENAAQAFGTACHELSEAALNGWHGEPQIRLACQAVAHRFLCKWEPGFSNERHQECQDLMVSVVTIYTTYVRSVITRLKEQGHEPEVRIEQRVNVAGKDCWGSLDVSIYVPFLYLEIIDLKGGAGKAVDPEENAQLLTYAAGECQRVDWALESVAITIVQPRRTDGRPPVCVWLTDPERVRLHLATVKKAIKAAKALDARPVAGDHCGWCVGKALCPAQRQLALSALGTDPAAPGDIRLPVPDALTPEQLGQVLAARGQVEAWFKACAAFALTNPPPGWKVVLGNSHRKWAEDAEAKLQAAGLCLAEFQESSFIGIPAAEKRLKAIGRKELSEQLFIKPEGKPTIARESDPRSPIDPLAALPCADESTL